MRDAFLCVESTTSFAVAGVLLHTTATVSFTCMRSTSSNTRACPATNTNTTLRRLQHLSCPLHRLTSHLQQSQACLP